MTNLKKQIRPVIPSITKIENFNAEEKFQNDVLRSIIKLQHDMIIKCFEHYLERNKVKMADLSRTKKSALIQKVFKSDTRLKIELRGLIIGLFTIDEYQEYLSQSPQLNKRINNMIAQRVDSCFD